MAFDLGGLNLDLLREELLAFIGARGRALVRDIEEFLQSDLTLFHSAHPYKRDGLKVLESNRSINVERPDGARRGSFPGDAVLTASHTLP